MKRRITTDGVGHNPGARQAVERKNGVIVKNCWPFTDCISEINNIQADDLQYLDEDVYEDIANDVEKRFDT